MTGTPGTTVTTDTTGRAVDPRATGGRVTSRAVAARALRVAGMGVVIVLALVAILTALRTELPRSPGVMSDALGPENGELIDGYLARASASLAGDDNDNNNNDDDDDNAADADAPRWALVTADRAWSVPEAAGMVRGLPRVSGLYVQVPVDGVAMPVSGVTLTEPTAGEAGREPAFERGLEQVMRRLDVGPSAADRATSDRATSDRAASDRAAAAAALTVARMREGEPAIVGLLARGTSAQLRAVAEQPGVRAVEALPADAVWEHFAVRPLQPQQVDAAVPLPDSAPVPPA
ncbi:hypothetical protein [Rhodococcus sp. IEGM 1408]|uniref:hypothetical protein n=1 Tax=Rhodococcus sp. IEGM 1408 TaxID=3082220 RepID=UPI002953426C|nr:hypothetical protein [Rhodococcus sp. IEGM 1408]MDV8001831.1 hypothetical protein [Rhodococcus sp. IEGM 1408]